MVKCRTCNDLIAIMRMFVGKIIFNLSTIIWKHCYMVHIKIVLGYCENIGCICDVQLGGGIENLVNHILQAKYRHLLTPHLYPVLVSTLAHSLWAHHTNPWELGGKELNGTQWQGNINPLDHSGYLCHVFFFFLPLHTLAASACAIRLITVYSIWKTVTLQMSISHWWPICLVLCLVGW